MIKTGENTNRRPEGTGGLLGIITPETSGVFGCQRCFRMDRQRYVILPSVANENRRHVDAGGVLGLILTEVAGVLRCQKCFRL